jgi:hypothetical protein
MVAGAAARGAQTAGLAKIKNLERAKDGFRAR